MKSYKTVDLYISSFPPSVAKKLETIRSIVKKSAKGVEEKVSYGMAGYKLNGVLVYFGGFKDHVSLFAMPSAVKAFKKDLKDFKTSKGTIQFPLDKPLPTTLIKKIVTYRVKENLARKKRK